MLYQRVAKQNFGLGDSEVIASSGYDQIFVFSLVLDAASIPHQVEKSLAGWVITTGPELQQPAVEEIAGYCEENRDWPPPDKATNRYSLFSIRHNPPTVLLMGIFIAFFQVTGTWSAGSKWFQAGAVVGAKILDQHEWWRLLTGLTLHADAVHLFGNVFIGGLLIHFLSQLLGSGIGWSVVLMAGILGNGLNVLLHTGGHNSVGFSTAVFGAVGALSGLNLVSRAGGMKNILLSLGGGLSLLALLGSSGERTDLGAHLWGLAAGMVLGCLVALWPALVKWGLIPRNQIFLLGGWGVVIWACWRQALGG